MQKISSASHPYFKRIFPLIWMGFVLFVHIAASSPKMDGFNIFTITHLAAMLLFGGWFIKKHIWNLVDEAYVCDGYFLIVNARLEEKISFSNILSVDCKPRTTTLKLKQKSALFGDKIAFAPNDISLKNLLTHINPPR